MKDHNPGSCQPSNRPGCISSQKAKMAEAFKESGNLLNEWMGSKAKALVSQLQEHGTKGVA